MKIPFRKNPMQKLEATVASLATRGEQLAAKRVTAQNALDKAIKARQEALLSGDLDDQRSLDKLQGTVDSATSALSGIDDALGLLAQQKAEADSQLVGERDRAERAKVSEEINAAVSDIEKRVEPTLSAMREIAEKLTALDHLSFEVGQLGRHLSGVAGEAEIAFAFVVPDVRRMADAVKDGSAAIPRRPKAASVPVPEPVAPKGVPNIGSDPALREANFTEIDRSGEARTVEIAVPRF
jgi:chromosome segregation ATPase